MDGGTMSENLPAPRRCFQGLPLLRIELDRIEFDPMEYAPAFGGLAHPQNVSVIYRGP